MSKKPTKDELLKVAKQEIFNLPMSIAVNNDTKNLTRRVISGGFLDDAEFQTIKKLFDENKYDEAETKWGFKLKHFVGKILWVREPAKVTEHIQNQHITGVYFEYLADGKKDVVNYNKRNLPNWIASHQGVPNGCIKEMARTFLRVTNIRIEMLQDISDEDCIREGIIATPDDSFDSCSYHTSIGEPDYESYKNVFDHYSENKDLLSLEKLAFSVLWDSTATKDTLWKKNPPVVIYEFEKVEYV